MVSVATTSPCDAVSFLSISRLGGSSPALPPIASLPGGVASDHETRADEKRPSSGGRRREGRGRSAVAGAEGEELGLTGSAIREEKRGRERQVNGSLQVCFCLCAAFLCPYVRANFFLHCEKPDSKYKGDAARCDPRR